MGIIKIFLNPKLSDSTSQELGSGVLVTIESLDLHREGKLLLEEVEKAIININDRYPGFDIEVEVIRYNKYAKKNANSSSKEA